MNTKSRMNFDWTKYVGMSDYEIMTLLDRNKAEEARKYKLIAYLYYRKMCKKRELELEEMLTGSRERLVAKYGGPAVERLEDAAWKNMYELRKIENTEKFKKHLFDIEKLGEVGEKLDRLSVDLGMKQEELNAVGFAVLAADDKSVPILEKIIESDEPADDPEIDEFRIASAETMESLLQLYKEGIKEPLATMMKAGLLRCCQNYADCKDKTEAVKWSGVIGDILNDLEQKPELIEMCGFSEHELDLAHGAVVMGEIIKTGMKALEAYQEAALSCEEIGAEKADEYTLAIIKMEMVFADREKQVESILPNADKPVTGSLQSQIGKNVTVEEARNGRVADKVEKLASQIKQTEAFKKIQRTDLFNRVSIFSQNADRRTIFGEGVYELEGYAKSVSQKQTVQKAEKEYESPTPAEKSKCVTLL